MIEINDVLKKHDLRTYSYRKNGKVVIIDSNKGKLVLKEKTNQSIYDYLDSRSFNYYPKMMIEDNRYDIMEYLDEIEMPSDQKMLDLIRLVSLLHNKTTYYKNVDVDEYKKNYEEITQDIHYLQGYYQDLITIIESKVYMSPPELLLASNISIILSALNYSKIELEKENTKDEKLKEETPSQECTVMVDVKGQVNQPGLYQLSCNSRVQDAILASGGALESADTSVLNLSKVLEDEMVIIVYSKEEVKSFSSIKEEVKKKEEKCENQTIIKNNACVTSEKIVVEDNSTGSSSSSNTNTKISLNHATKEELLTLTGIGESKANLIIEYRNQNGGFKTIEEIKNVKGIGDKMFEKIKDNITI